ncbi:MAG: T9SS type A sorting domain-containing protein, partial [Aliifodinibius sp.]|nr:T9SS type A sorting domain-containing protein [Fodinibius sp.]NIV10519.1 T9SS type A sorting domain-containing protein [Fodinibius sp.]NIY24127.1 T9SS type A sorting domain-containing protein [Fodinibius sp.]
MFTSGKANPAPVDWNCIHIGSGPMSIFDYVIMEYSGGGIRHYNPSDALNLSVSHSTLRKNNSALSLDGNAIVTNNLIIVDVPSQFSRGILVQHDSVQIINNTIVEGGFGIRLNSCNPTIENNIIYNSQNGIYDQNSDSNPAISYNDVLALQQNFVNMHPELGVLSTTNFNGDSCDIFYNISLDPLFVDVNSGNYHLAPNSPCVDAGDPAILDPDSTISDMGAYGGGTVVKIINRRPNMVVKKYKLFQNYPNPFNPTTTINYQLPIRTKVELTIYNLLGQQIKTLVDSKQIAGDYKVQWDGSNDAGRQVASGIYVYRLKTEGFVRS